MAQLKFAVDPAGNNAPPLNGNTVPCTGLQGIVNTSEFFAYAALIYENIHETQDINFGGLTGTLPVCRVRIAETSKGEKFLEVVGYIPLNSNYAAFPEGKKLHKQVSERLPNNPAATDFNY